MEDLIRRHEDFEKTLEAQDDKANALKRTTLVRSSIFVYPLQDLLLLGQFFVKIISFWVKKTVEISVLKSNFFSFYVKK